jgi:actin-related protein 5
MDIHMKDVQNIYRLPTPTPLLSTPPVESYDDHRSHSTPLIIDNGSTTLRWGFSTSSEPQSGTNAVAKYKERRNNRPLLLFGEGIDSESGAKGQAKTPWEGDVLLNFDALVCIMVHTTRANAITCLRDVGKRPRLCFREVRNRFLICESPDPYD